MSKIREIREAIDTKLDQWEAGVTSVEAQLQQTKEQAVEELERRKLRLSDTLEEFKGEMEKVKGLTHENLAEIQGKFDDLRVQLALGKAEARDAFEAWKDKVQDSIRALEATVDKQLDASGQAVQESLRKAAADFIAAADRLEAEMELLAMRFEVKTDDIRTLVEHKKRELTAEINRYKANLKEKKQMARDRAETFESELSQGVGRIKQAFKKLFD